MAMGAIQTIGGWAGLNNMGAMPHYSVTPELAKAKAEAEARAKYGFTPEQEAAFQNQLASQSNQRYRMATNVGGGNMSSAINAGINYGNTNALLQHAAQGSQLQESKKQYADRYADKIQSIADRNTMAGQNLWMKNQQAFGSAVSSGMNNIATGAMMMMKPGGATGDATDAAGAMPPDPAMTAELGKLTPGYRTRWDNWSLPTH